MRANVLPAEGNLVRLSVEVDEAEFDKAVQTTVKRLGRQLRVPGFRPGKVPRQVLEARLGGASALREEAFRDALPDLYARAVADTNLDPIAAPAIDITSGREHGGLQFDAVVEIRPTVGIAGYQGLVVTVPPLEVTDEDVDERIDRLREQSGELVTVGRPAINGDVVTIDLHASAEGNDPLDLEDYLYEIGTDTAVPGLDNQLLGSKPGDILAFTNADGATGAGSQDEPGERREASYRVLVKEVKEKRLPEADDAWAQEASEFQTVAELRDELRERLGRMKRLEAQLAMREHALDALEALVSDELPETLVDERLQDRLVELRDGLKARGVTIAQFLGASGRSQGELLAQIREQAVHDVRRDLALRALGDAEELEASDEDVDEAITALAARAKVPFAQMKTRLDRAGRLPEIRSDRRKAKALAWLVEHVDLVDEHGAAVDRQMLEGDNAPAAAVAAVAADEEDEMESATS